MNLFKVNSKDTRKRHQQRVNVHCDYDHFRSCFHCFTQASFKERFIISKIFMELLMENKGKVVDDFLLNLKFTVSKAGLKIYIMLHWFSLFFVLPIWFALWHVRRLRWWSFLVCFTFVSFSLISTRPQKAIYQKVIFSNLESGISKTEDKFLTTSVMIFFINNKTRCTYFKPWCQVV